MNHHLDIISLSRLKSALNCLICCMMQKNFLLSIKLSANWAMCFVRRKISLPSIAPLIKEKGYELEIIGKTRTSPECLKRANHLERMGRKVTNLSPEPSLDMVVGLPGETRLP